MSIVSNKKYFNKRQYCIKCNSYFYDIDKHDFIRHSGDVLNSITGELGEINPKFKAATSGVFIRHKAAV